MGSIAQTVCGGQVLPSDIDAVVAVALYISDGTRPIVRLLHQFGSSQLAKLTGKDIIVILADHRIAKGSVLQNVDLTIIVYNIVNFLPSALYACHCCCHVCCHICRSWHCIYHFRPGQVRSILGRRS